MAALRATVFPLSAKNKRGGHILPTPPVRVLTQSGDMKLHHPQRHLYMCS